MENKTQNNYAFEKRYTSSTTGVGETVSTRRAIKRDPNRSACTKVNSKRNKDLKISPKTLKPLEDKIRFTVQDTGESKDFLNRLQSLKKQKPTDEWNLSLHSS